jgi:hypothetical protein
LVNDGQAHLAHQFGRGCGHVNAIEHDAPATRCDGPRHNPDERRFAGAVLTDQSMHLAAADAQRDVGKRAHTRIVLADAMQFEHRVDGCNHISQPLIADVGSLTRV